MNMNQIFTLLSLGIASVSLAQPTLTFNANAPQPGPGHEWRFSTYIAPGQGGSGQVWDFSQLSTDSTAMVSLVDPTTTTFGAQFPTATVAEVSDGSTVFFRTDANGVYMLGYEAEGFPVVYSNEGRFMSFPCTHQTNWNDTYAASFQDEDVEVGISGNITAVADGHGTLVLPSGSVTNVLRVHWTQEEETQYDLFTFSTEFDSYLYYVPGRSYPLVQTVTATTTTFGNSIVTQFTQWIDDITTSTPDAAAERAALDLFPVPASDRLRFSLPAHFSGAPLVTITDATGRTVRGVDNLRTNGTQGSLDVSVLPAGVYQFIATDELGQRATSRFTVE